jgi:hypothetical protein
LADILQLLETVDSYVRTAGSPASASPTKRSTGGRDSEATYSIDKKRNEDEVLTEHRAGGSSQPFRCPRYIYDTIAKVLDHAQPALDFDELMNGLVKAKVDPAEFQVRAALRFLLGVSPAILTRDRNRYKPVRVGKFEADAKSAWTALAKAPKKAV